MTEKKRVHLGEVCENCGSTNTVQWVHIIRTFGTEPEEMPGLKDCLDCHGVIKED